VTYNKFFDALFYSYWVGFGVLALYVAAMLLIRKRCYPNSDKLWPGALLYGLVPFLWIMTMGEVNPFALGYGKPYEITGITLKDGALFVKDYIMSSGSKATRGVRSYRMHVIDPETGQKKLRFLLGGGGVIMSIKGDSLIFGYSDAVISFSATSGRIIREWTAKTLPGIFPELKSGVNDFSLEKERQEINLTSLDGNKWTLNFMTSVLVPYDGAEKEEKKTINKITLDKYGIYMYDGEHEKRVAALHDKPDGERQQVLWGHNDVGLNDEVFLEGKIVALSLKDSCFIVQHYETIKMLKVIFTCMSLDGKRKIWEVRQSVLRPHEFNDESLKVNSCIDEQNGIFFATMKDEIIALSIKDGKVMWREVP